MRRLAMIALVLTTLTPAASQGQTEDNRGSAGYLLQLCKTWLDFAEKEGDTPSEIWVGRSLFGWQPRECAWASLLGS